MDLLGEHPAHDRTAVLERNRRVMGDRGEQRALVGREVGVAVADELADLPPLPPQRDPHCERPSTAFGTGNADRKSTRLNSSHVEISYAVFCLKKKKKKHCSRSTLYKKPKTQKEK